MPSRLHPTRLAALLLGLVPLAASAEDSTGAVTAGAAFNPQVSLILTGRYYQDNENGEGPARIDAAAAILRPPVVEDGPGNGFALGESELVLAATVDPYFDAKFIGTFDGQGSAEVEEAYLQTRRLPAGLKAKAGKFKSEIGYENSQHPHAWDFDDQNLAYATLLGDGGLADSGLQLTWLPDTPVYVLLGAEALQGRDQLRFGSLPTPEEAAGVITPAAGALPEPANGPRLLTAFAKVAPDLGDDHALQLGVSVARARQAQQLVDPDGSGLSGDEYALDGRETLYGVDVVYKYDTPGEDGAGDLKVVAEYLLARTDMSVAAADAAAVFHDGAAAGTGDRVRGTQDGYYVQATYGIAPRWQLGLRHDAAGNRNELTEAGTTTTLADSARNTLALSFQPSEFSRLRLQAARGTLRRDNGSATDLDQVMLSYTLSLGAHGAHRF